MKSILVGIAKNEGMYIREWVLYHKLVCGFDAIHVYNNDSEDDTKEQLDRLSGEGFCTHEEWPRSPGRNPPQPTAYNDAVKKFKKEFDWLCFMDIDEFLVLNTDVEINTFVSQFEEDIGSVSFNWLIFYSLKKNTSKNPVTKRVLNFKDNNHVKTIARTKAIKSVGIHTFHLIEPYRYMHCSGSVYNINNDIKTSLDAKMCIRKEYLIRDTTKAQINHYHMKSEEEVVQKDLRGRATLCEYKKKNILGHYIACKNIKNHNIDTKIFQFIEKRFGLEKFYKKLEE